MLPAEQQLKELPIVAVDDDEPNVLLLRRVLERGGYTRLTTTTDPREVPRMVEEHRPRLLILDLHMPRVDGFELMEQLGGLAGRVRGAGPGAHRGHHRGGQATGAHARGP